MLIQTIKRLMKIKKRICFISVFFVCIILFNACRKNDFKTSGESLVTQSEVSRILLSVKKGLTVNDLNIVENEVLGDRHYLNYIDFLDSSVLQLIVPVLNDGDKLKGFVRIKVDKKKEIISRDSYDLSTLDAASDKILDFVYFVQAFKNIGYELQPDVNFFVLNNSDVREKSKV